MNECSPVRHDAAGEPLPRGADDRDHPDATRLGRGETNRLLDGVELAESAGLRSLMTTRLIVGDDIYGKGNRRQVRGMLTETGERAWEAEGLTTRNRWGPRERTM